MQKKHEIKPQAVRFKRFSRKAYGVFNSLHKVVNTGVVTASVLQFANATRGSSKAARAFLGSHGIEDQELDASAASTPPQLEVCDQLITQLLVASTRLDVQPRIGRCNKSTFKHLPSTDSPLHKPHPHLNLLQTGNTYSSFIHFSDPIQVIHTLPPTIHPVHDVVENRHAIVQVWFVNQLCRYN